MRAAFAALVICCAVQPPIASAQVVSADVQVESYSLGSSEDLSLSSVRLMTLQFGAQARIAPGLALAVLGGYADAEAGLGNGAKTALNGPVDTRVSVEVRGNGLHLTASALLPTGDVAKTTTDATVVGLLSTDLLPFTVSHWGRGGGFAGDVGYRLRPGSIALELSVGGSYLGESTVQVAGPLTYRPGREFRARGSIEAGVGSGGVLSVLFGYQNFGSDIYGEVDVFRPASRIEGVASLAFPLGARESTLTYAGLYRLASADLPPGMGVDPALPPSIAGVGGRASRMLFLAGTEMRFGRGAYSLVPRGDLRVLRNEEGVGQGWVASLGGRVEFEEIATLLGQRVLFAPRAQIHVGRLVASQGVRSSVLGLDVGVVTYWGGGR